MMNFSKLYRKCLSKLCLAATALAFAACQTDELPAPQATAPGTVEFEIGVAQAETPVSRSTSVASENAIQALDVLAFDADGRFFRHFAAGELYTIDGGGKWLYRLPLPENEAQGLHFVFFANLRDEVSRAVAEGRITSKDDLYRQIRFANTDWAAGTGPFPLWGETPGGYDSQSTHQGLNRVSMLRPVSVVDVVLNGNATEAMGIANFKLACVEVRDVPAEGYAAPAPGHFEWAERSEGAQLLNEYVVKKATVVADAGMMSLRAGGTAGVNALRGAIIVPESDAGGKWNTTFIIGGYYGNDTQLSWYKVEFSEKDQATGLQRRADILRNKHYILNITGVGQAGYATADEAYANQPENIHATLELKPETDGLANVAYNASAYIATDKAELHVAAQKGDSIVVLTSATEGWRLSGMPHWLEASASSGKQGTRATIAFRLKEGFAAADCHPADITLQTGRLALKVKVFPGDGNTIEYETPYVSEVLQAADFGFAESDFAPGGGMAFLHGRYLILANNGNAATPSVVVYDMTAKSVAATISEWTHNGQTQSFGGTEGKPDYIDDIAVNERNSRLYVARRQSCVEVFDISDPSKPEYVTRIGKLYDAAAFTRNRLSGSGAVLATDGYLLVRDDMSLDTYLHGDIAPGNFQEITCVTRDNQTMTHSGHQPAQWAVDPADGAIYLTDYSGSFKGIYRIDPSRADQYAEKGLYWRQHDLRSHAFALGYKPTGLLITQSKVYVTRQDGTLDVFSRSLLAGAPALAATRTQAAQAEKTVSLRTTTGRYGKLQKIYQAPNDPESFWSIDVTNNALVRLNMFRSSIEVEG